MAKGRNRRTSKYKKQEQQQRKILYGTVAAIVVAIVGFIVYSFVTAPPEVSAERLELEATVGQAAAPVEIVEYGAYGCHSCRQVHQSGILQQVLQQYGDQVRFRFRNFPVIHPNDPVSAEAAQCALDQSEETFWTFHNALYDISDAEYSSMRGGDDYVAFAADLSLDDEALQTCLDENTHARTVDHWESDSRENGVVGTPTFFVNGRRLNSPSQLGEFVQRELAAN